MLRTETMRLIALLAPSLRVFRRVQLAHSTCRTTPAMQFMVRCSWRKMCYVGHRWTHYLPNGYRDGLQLRQAIDNSTDSFEYYVNGLLNGISKYCYCTGQLEYLITYRNGKRHGHCEYWNIMGRLRWRDDYVDNQSQGPYIRLSDKAFHCAYRPQPRSERLPFALTLGNLAQAANAATKHQN